jgi:mannose-1-phosphate guanylyltransferase
LKALLLTGGFGTRLRPLTFTRPKHLLPIGNRPHMERVFDLLAAHGVDDVVLTTSYLADAFAATVAAARARGLRLEVTHEHEPLGTAGAIKNAESHLAHSAFLVFNGDILTDVDLGALATFHRDRGAEATILLTPVADPSAYGVVPTEPDGRVRGFIEKPPRDEAPTNLINAGVYLFEPSVLDRVPAGEPWSAETQLFPGLVAEGAGLYALPSTAYWMDIGTPQKYLQANLDFLSGRYGGHEARSFLSDPDAVIEDGARVSSTCLGRGAHVEAGATVTDAVLLPAARIGRDATVTRSILGEGARVAAGARLEDATVADEDEVTGA